MLEGAPSKRHTKSSPKPLVRVVKESVVVYVANARKGVVVASSKASSVPVRARAMATVTPIPTMVNNLSALCFP